MPPTRHLGPIPLAVLATSLCGVSPLLAMRPALRDAPLWGYFHENQFAHPLAVEVGESNDVAETKRAIRAGWQFQNLLNAWCADWNAFNGAHNRDTFLVGARRLFDRAPEPLPGDPVGRIESRRQNSGAGSNGILNCGPELRTWRLSGTDDLERRTREAEDYRNFLVETFVRLVGEALEARVEADASYVQSRCGFAMNRCLPTGDGGFRNAPNPDGPVDHRVPVLHVQAADDQRDLAVVFGYACHCTTLNHQRFNGDYAGYAQAMVEEARPGAVALFVKGCGGDQNPYPRRRFELAEAHGRTLALAVESALETPPRALGGGHPRGPARDPTSIRNPADANGA